MTYEVLEWIKLTQGKFQSGVFLLYSYHPAHHEDILDSGGIAPRILNLYSIYGVG